jgi:hypothetical protein
VSKEFIHCQLGAYTRELVGRRTNNEVNLFVLLQTGLSKCLLRTPDGFGDVQVMEVKRTLLTTLDVTDVEYVVVGLHNL